jgi:hypothetical protein
MRRIIKESFGVKLGRGEPVKPFNTLEDAVDYINKGMKTRESDTFVLYNDDKEMIWLDYYTERDMHSLGYTVARQEDKNSVVFDKGTLKIKEVDNDDQNLRFMTVQEVGKQGHVNAAAKLAKFKFIEDNSKPSYLDLSAKVAHFNKDEALGDIAAVFADQLTAKTESVDPDAEELTELFGFKKKKKYNRYLVGVTQKRLQPLDFTAVVRELEKILRNNAAKVDEDKKWYNYPAATAFRFWCTEQEYSHIKTTVEYLSFSKLGRSVSSGYSDLRNNYKKAFEWKCLAEGVDLGESIQPEFNPTIEAERNPLNQDFPEVE